MKKSDANPEKKNESHFRGFHGHNSDFYNFRLDYVL